MLTIAFVLLSIITSAQTKINVSGIVRDGKNVPLPEAVVTDKESGNSVSTGSDGKFKLTNVNSNSQIEISYVGFETQVLPVSNKATINVTMHEKSTGLDEVVVVAFGKSNSKKLSSSVSTIKAEDIAIAPVTSITQSLAGRAPGLIVTQSGGGINANGSVSIRGGGTPLIVINGIVSKYSDYDLLNPDDIATFSILKDAASTAMYGARAGDGVIVVTTKKGKGKANIKFSTDFMMTQPTFPLDKLSSYEKATLENELKAMYKNQTGSGPRWTDAELEKYRTGSDPYKYPNTQWEDIALKEMAPQYRYNLSMDGGSEENNYYASFGVLNIGTIFRDNTNSQKRYNFNLRTSSTIGNTGLTVTPAINGYIENTEAPLNQSASGGIDGYYGAVFSHIVNRLPYQLGENQNGQLYAQNDNPLVDMSPLGGYHKRYNQRMVGQVDLDWKLPWVKGLTMNAIANYSTLTSGNKMWNQTAPVYDLNGAKGPNQPMSLSKSKAQEQSWSVQYLVNYDKTFAEKHNVKATVGYEASYIWGDNLSGSRDGYILPIDQMGSGPASTQKNSATEYEEGRAGIIASLGYEFNNKYQLGASMRHDGSDYFAEGKRWGNFYSTWVGWTVSNEKFFDYLKSNDILDYFKIRATYGETGKNSGIGRYAYMQSYGYNAEGIVIDGKLYPTFSEGALPSPDISWFTQTTTNIGFDFETLKNRLRGSFDYFYMETTGFLASPSNIGFTDPLGIALPTVLSDGEQRREGYDFSLSWRDKVGEVNYEVGGNYTHYDQINSVNWQEATTALKNPYTRSTQQMGYWGVGYTNSGYYQNSQDVMNNPRMNVSNLVPGDIIYKDFNGDGKIDGNDQTRIGKSGSPRGNYGINGKASYKGFSFDILFQGSTRRDISIGTTYQGQPAYGFVIDEHKDYWRPDNTDAQFPRPQGDALLNGGNNYQTSDFWLINAGYFRLKNLAVGYDFKNSILKNDKVLSLCKLTFSGNNLFTISDATKWGLDPETASSTGWGYPVSRTYSLSLNIGF
ncbi:hypothetical protein EM308_06280 [Flavobacterium gilvum]|uniref:TonB-dependent receptor plug domain-containing protein n=1 Tax=Flavobacterium gilvum TaxID=1492737 RepID=A0AAC9I695_9FLAO|nr:hypothetical protein EM308_06280 [Flavobacterium gilvum]